MTKHQPLTPFFHTQQVSSFDLIEHLSTGVFSAHNFKSAGCALGKSGVPPVILISLLQLSVNYFFPPGSWIFEQWFCLDRQGASVGRAGFATMHVWCDRQCFRLAVWDYFTRVAGVLQHAECELDGIPSR